MQAPAESPDLFAILRAVAQSDFEHGATCPYCIEEREGELLRQLGAQVKARNGQSTLAAAIVKAHAIANLGAVPA